MQNGRLIQEQPGLGVGWPRTADGRVAPLVLPSGELAHLPRWSLDAAGNAVGLVGPDGNAPNFSVGQGGEVSSITYSDGRVTAYVESGVTYTLTYDVQGRLETVAGNGITRTVTYNLDGAVASFA